MGTIIDLSNFSFSNERSLFRKELINIFLNEVPGNGKGDKTSRYIYIVKQVGENDIFLKRPAHFNNGFDFTINVSNMNFNPNGRKTTRPTHGNILNDLAAKKNENEAIYTLLHYEIERIYNCQNPISLNFDFNVGLNPEILLECIKWLFVEQDVTYWNYSGRRMFYDKIKNLLIN
jgi:hypothetical protein